MQFALVFLVSFLIQNILYNNQKLSVLEARLLCLFLYNLIELYVVKEKCNNKT